MKEPMWIRAVLALLVSLSILQAAEWETLRNCRFLPNESNDGDSFHVENEGKEFIFRLYFVDTPESEDSLPERVAEQAAHFDVTPDRAIEIGRYAKQASAQLLSRPFTVTTRFQDAMGRSKLPRYYAFITTADNEDLGEVLLSSGLARAFGVAAAPPKETVAELRNRYDSLQSDAKRKKLGAWGTGPIRRAPKPTSSLPTQTPRPEPVKLPPSQPTQPQTIINEKDTADILANLDPFNRPPPVQTPVVRQDDYSEIPGWKPKAPTAEQAPTKGDSRKISLNTATKPELESLPGIGPELASRIIAARPFATVDDMKRVNGIGPTKFAAVAPLVVP